MVATFWLTIVGPTAQMFGVNPAAIAGVMALFFAILIAAFAIFKLENKEFGVWIFCGAMFLEAIMGMLDWIIFALMFVVIIAVEMKIGHGS